jgi:2Fe-2S ferredoxin
MSYINVIDENGSEHRVEAVSGWRVMEILRDYGFSVGGLCGGACACATCHVDVCAQWVAKLHPANDDEEAMLDQVPDVGPMSRLSCQIIWSDALDGLSVKLSRKEA